MKLKWKECTTVKGNWDLEVDEPDSDVEVMAWVKCVAAGRYKIIYWNTTDDAEVSKEVTFNGPIAKAKAYTIALVRMG